MIRIPQINNLETALKIYYEKNELTNSDIKSLFGNISLSKVFSLKKLARDKMVELSVLPYDATSVNTAVAFEAWGINPEDLERRLIKLRKLKLIC